MRGLIQMTIMLGLAPCVLAISSGYSDQQVSEMVLRSGRVIDNPDMEDRMMHRAEWMCDYDTNRLARIIYDLAHTNDEKVAMQMVLRLGTYGSLPHLSFLYEVSANAACGLSAMASVLSLSGVTDASVTALSAFLRNSQAGHNDKIYACWSFSDEAKRVNASQALRARLQSVFLDHGMSNATVAVMFDDMMRGYDPTYSNSQRRLRVLRSVVRPGLHSLQQGYVTNAINQLVAYPEASLPE